MITRKIFALFILLAGTGIAIRNLNYQNKKPEANNFLTASLNNTEVIDPNLSFKNSLQLPQAQATTQEPTDEPTNNITDLLARSMFGKIASENKNNLSDPNGIKNIALPQTLLETNDPVINEKISRAFDFKKFETPDVRTSNDDSSQAQINYLDSMDAALEKSFGGFNKNSITAIEAYVDKKDPQFLNQLIDMTPRYLDELLRLKPPSNWQTFHLENLNLWQEKLIIYKKILELESDPLMAYLAIQKIPGVVQKDLDLQNISNKKYQELKKATQ